MDKVVIFFPQSSIQLLVARAKTPKFSLFPFCPRKVSPAAAGLRQKKPSFGIL
jgi:hypothetical protein